MVNVLHDNCDVAAWRLNKSPGSKIRWLTKTNLSTLISSFAAVDFLVLLLKLRGDHETEQPQISASMQAKQDYTIHLTMLMQQHTMFDSVYVTS